MLTFFAGLLIGGCVAGMFLCCMQLHRIQNYERKIQTLLQKLNAKE